MFPTLSLSPYGSIHVFDINCWSPCRADGLSPAKQGVDSKWLLTTLTTNTEYRTYIVRHLVIINYEKG